MIKARENSIGAWAFLIGIVMAVIMGFFTIFFGNYMNPIIIIFIALLGLIVGYFVAEKDIKTFLLASTASVVAAFAGIQGLATNVALLGINVSGVQLGKMLASILSALLFLFVPATIIVALKTVFSLSKI